jgi:hypothetical protein
VSPEAVSISGHIAAASPSAETTGRPARARLPAHAEKFDTSCGDPSELSTNSDERLLAQIKNGDKEALGRLFRRHAGTVRNVAYRILRSEGEADDLVQDVFLFIYRKASLFNSAHGRAATWILQIVAS